MKTRLTILLFWLLFSCTASAETVISQVKIQAIPDILRAYHKVMAGRSIEEFSDYGEIGADGGRVVAELILLQQALFLGGCNCEIDFIEGSDYYSRNLKQMLTGELVLSSDTFWFGDLKRHQDKLFISTPVIASGEYEAGLYTTIKNDKALKISHEQLYQLVAVSNSQWSADWNTINSLPFKRIEDVNNWIAMVRLVDQGLVDVMLSVFLPTQDLVLSWQDIRLRPIPNIKVVLNDSRHFAVSREHPDGEKLFNSMNFGLRLLSRQGKIKEAYTKVGTFNQRVANWRVLNR